MIGGLAIGLVESLTKAYIGTITAGIITSRSPTPSCSPS